MDTLTDQYPTPEILRAHFKAFSDEDFTAYIRLWLSEGIPFAFKSNPFQYEKVRTFIGKKLDINPKEITIIGSARTGIAFDPNNFGRIFSPNSDHDFSLISEPLFEACRDAFQRWEIDYKSGNIQAVGIRQQRYWEDSIPRLPKNIKKGFLDPHKIPSRYAPIDRITALETSISKTFALHKPSFRVYRNWDSFIEQGKFSLKTLTSNL
jgi:hypothetical protein